MNRSEYEKTNITTATTTQVFTGKGVLHGIQVNTTAAGVVAYVDGTAAGTSQTIGILKASVAENFFGPMNASISAGLRVYTAGASDITVFWAQG